MLKTNIVKNKSSVENPKFPFEYPKADIIFFGNDTVLTISGNDKKDDGEWDVID